MKNGFVKQLFLKLFRATRPTVIDSKSFFVGKVAVVIGGTRGTGLAIASALRDSGATVVVAGSTGKIEKQYFDGVNAYLEAHKVDIINNNDVNRLFMSVINKYKKIDILVNSAGVFNSSSFSSTKIDDIKKH